ncbi:MAG: FAD-dependent oxidoreductase [Hyphomicrobiaceae bacterium]|nr:FAD-dependent oxidoreductase [Hyphomicrobiaceae bacterium]
MAHDYDLCIVGGGSAGLTVAAGAAQLGARVVLIERGEMGGDCLNYGCVPSKALIAAGHAAQAMRDAGRFGIAPVEPSVDFAATMDRVRSVIAAIAPNDSVERFEKLGVRVLRTSARFVSPDTVEAGGERIRAHRCVIASGSRPAAPPIPGLDSVPYLTNETVFANRQRPQHLVIIGGGPIGMELAQAHHRLGSKVTVVEAGKALSKDDPELTALVLDRLREEGIEIREGAAARRVSASEGRIRVEVEGATGPATVEGSHLLIAAGRKPNVSDLGLEAAGIAFDAKGIKVGPSLVTSNPVVYAIGDVIGGLQFTHVANYHAGIVIRRALFRMPAKVDPGIIPWVTFTDPELAHVGLTEAEAASKHGKVNVLRWPYHENDRAQAEHATAGHVKVVTDKKGRILGASIVGEHAGELIQMWALALSQKMNIRAMTGFVSPYPTLTEINKRAAYKFFAGAPGSPILRKVIGFLAKLG